MSSALDAAEIRDLIQASPPWYRNGNLIKLYLLLIAPILTSTAWGFDLIMTNGLQSVDTFMDRFGNPTGSTLGFYGASMAVGGLAACILASPVSDHFGRRLSVSLGAAIIVGMALMQTFSTNFKMFSGAKLLLGFGSNLQQLSAPVLVTELAHPKQRVTITSIYNSSILLGQIVGAWITFGTYRMPSQWGWKIPCLLQVVLPTYQIFMIWLCPESPRWLVSKGRIEEARQILIRYHSSEPGEDAVVRAEMQEIIAGVEADKTQVKLNWKGIKTIVGIKGNRHRLWLAFWTAVGSQCSGGAFVASYLPKILDQVGMTTSKEKTLINGIMTICNWLTSFIAAFIIPRVPRRKLFLFSTINMTVAFIIWTALTARYHAEEKSSYGIAVVVMIFVYNFFQAMCWIPMVVTYPLETVTTKQRGIFFAWTLLVINASSFVASYINPIALDAISWRYYIVQCVFNGLLIVIIYFTYVETQGMTLEEIAVLFDGEQPFREASEMASAVAEKTAVDEVRSER
ncbi:hypothetical protein FDECE_9125 [Fusarium decemcellulare]|nr:hypothetical protein FDECE_9125 [Fusarium decemcellulare]